jgi:four helix bundle protein
VDRCGGQGQSRSFESEFRQNWGMTLLPKQEIQSYRDLGVWQRGMQITEDIYRLTSGFPSEEKFGLTSQLRRAAASVPANIAEGHSRSSTKDFFRHLSIAVGSLAEVTTFVELAERLKFVDTKTAQLLFDSAQEERRMLRGLQSSLRKKIIREQ